MNEKVVAPNKKIDLKITLEAANDIPAFAAYCNYSGRKGSPKMVFNFMGMVISCAEQGDSAKEYKMYFAESVVHEMLHMIQDIYDQVFDEDEVEDAIMQTRKFMDNTHWEIGPGEGKLKEGEPCSHTGCLSHVTHPCEVCGRVAGRTKV